MFKIALTLQDLAVKEGKVWNCKYSNCSFCVYYTVYGMTESRALKEMLEHWKKKHEYELSVIMAAKEHDRQAKNK